jgi:hypothetical protein
MDLEAGDQTGDHASGMDSFNFFSRHRMAMNIPFTRGNIRRATAKVRKTSNANTAQ